MRRIVLFVVFFIVFLLSGSATHAGTISQEDLKRVVQDHFALVLQEGPPGFQVTKVIVAAPLRLPEGPVMWRFKLPERLLRPGRLTIPVTAVVEKIPVRTVRTVVHLTRNLRVPVLRRALQRGEVVQETDLRWHREAFDRPLSDLMIDPKALIGQRAKRSLRPDLPLRANWFEIPPAVERGEIVRVVMERAGLRIYTEGKALAQGVVGDRIPLLNIESRKRYTARIVSSGVARIDLRN